MRSASLSSSPDRLRDPSFASSSSSKGDNSLRPDKREIRLPAVETLRREDILEETGLSAIDILRPPVSPAADTENEISPLIPNDFLNSARAFKSSGCTSSNSGWRRSSSSFEIRKLVKVSTWSFSFFTQLVNFCSINKNANRLPTTSSSSSPRFGPSNAKRIPSRMKPQIDFFKTSLLNLPATPSVDESLFATDSIDENNC